MIETIDLAIGELEAHPQNARTHDVETLKLSLDRFGQYRAIVVQKPSGRRKRHRILAGHGTYRAMRELAYERVSAHVLDVDDDTAKRIVLMDNRSNDKAGYNEQALAELLASLPDLDGTGFSQDDLDKMVLDAQDELDAGEQAIPETYDVLISCDSETEQVALLERLSGEGLKCRALLS